MKIAQHIENLYYPPICEYKAKANKLLNLQAKIFDLNQAVPNYPPPMNIVEEIKNSFSGKDYAFYTPDEGLEIVRDTIISELNKHFNNKIGISNVCITAGANNAFYSVLSTICKAGDEILLLSPYYFNHYMTAKILQLNIKEIQLEEADGFSVPFEKIKDAIGKNTRAVVLVNPSNPTGKSYSQETVNKLYKLCEERKIYYISDEVYMYFHENFPNLVSILNSSENLDYGISIHSFSKTFSLTGFRVGFVATNQRFINEMIKVQDSNIICASRIAQIAAMEGLKGSKVWLEGKVKELSKRIEIFKEKISNSKHWKILSSGAFFVYLKYLGGKTSDEICSNLISKHNIVALPAKFFGQKQGQNIRVAIGNIAESDIEIVCEILNSMSPSEG